MLWHSKDTCGIRRDLIATGIATPLFSLVTVVTSIAWPDGTEAFTPGHPLAQKVNIMHPPMHWNIYGILVMHFTSTTLPLIESYGYYPTRYFRRKRLEKDESPSPDVEAAPSVEMQSLPNTAAYRRHAARLAGSPMEQFHNVMRDPELFARYKEFAARDLVTENPVFWEHYTKLIRTLPNPPQNPSKFTSPEPVPQHLIPAFLKIYTTFLLPNAPLELNLPGGVTQTVWGQMEPVRLKRPGVGVRRDVFVVVAGCVEQMIFDSIPRFMEFERDEYVKRRRADSGGDRNSVLRERGRREARFSGQPSTLNIQYGTNPTVTSPIGQAVRERPIGTFEGESGSRDRGDTGETKTNLIGRERGYTGESRIDLTRERVYGRDPIRSPTESPRERTYTVDSRRGYGGDAMGSPSESPRERTYTVDSRRGYGSSGREQGRHGEWTGGYGGEAGRERSPTGESHRGYSVGQGYREASGRERAFTVESQGGHRSPVRHEREYAEDSHGGYRSPVRQEREYTGDSQRGYRNPVGGERGYTGDSQGAYRSPVGRERGYTDESAMGYGSDPRRQRSNTGEPWRD
ncbi:hypothetical protein HDV00_008068 [Rhizophlyctis rosea]|nr:hypothetical protein HDV00_008068 [Rhizophlyctis rosea]